MEGITLNIGAKVEVRWPTETGSTPGTYTGAQAGMRAGAMSWVRLVEGDNSSKILVPTVWLTEIKPPLPPEPIDADAVVIVRRPGGAYPYWLGDVNENGSWIDSNGYRVTWPEICERDKEGAPVQVWPQAERKPLPIQFRAELDRGATSMTWPSTTGRATHHVAFLDNMAAMDLKGLINRD